MLLELIVFLKPLSMTHNPLQQIRFVDRLGNVIITPCFHCLCPVSLQCFCRLGNNDNIFVFYNQLRKLLLNRFDKIIQRKIMQYFIGDLEKNLFCPE